ncbi:MAG TPA: hypothetical protein VHN82_08175 [Methanoregula sp.]|nr:hypothetical protein [Methanoregula sp.]
MAKEKKCARCGKDAIGIESFGCCTAYVCSDHASSLLLELAPGTTLSSGECYLERFSTTREVPDPGSG